MSMTTAVTVYDHSLVAPSGDAPVEQILPMTFLDVFWLYFHPIPRLLCYPYPSSTTHFFQTLLPNLKKSLSQTLRYYLPLAGNYYHPLHPNSALPHLRYLPGDSVLFIAAVAGEGFDFTYLTGNQPRDVDAFHSFVPDLPQSRIDPDLGFEVIPVLAVQVTLFPETGICVGITNHHIVGDASSLVGFIKAWGSIARLGNLPDNNLLPFYDRSVIQDPSGRLNSFWNQIKRPKYEPVVLKLPTKRVRATFTLEKSEIEELRNRVIARSGPSGSLHLSSFTIATACVWSCMVKSCAPSGELVDDEELESLIVPIAVRHRIEPPVPAEYFGNLLGCLLVESRHGNLKEENGFFTAVELVGNMIAKKVNNKAELWRNAGDWMATCLSFPLKRTLGVAGSPKFNLYETDFGWGRAMKYEALSIDFENGMSLSKSPKLEGGLEIQTSLAERKMKAFAAAFTAVKSVQRKTHD